MDLHRAPLVVFRHLKCFFLGWFYAPVANIATTTSESIRGTFPTPILVYNPLAYQHTVVWYLHPTLLPLLPLFVNPESWQFGVVWVENMKIEIEALHF